MNLVKPVLFRKDPLINSTAFIPRWILTQFYSINRQIVEAIGGQCIDNVLHNVSLDETSAETVERNQARISVLVPFKSEWNNLVERLRNEDPERFEILKELDELVREVIFELEENFELDPTEPVLLDYFANIMASRVDQLILIKNKEHPSLDTVMKMTEFRKVSVMGGTLLSFRGNILVQRHFKNIETFFHVKNHFIPNTEAYVSLESTGIELLGDPKSFADTKPELYNRFLRRGRKYLELTSDHNYMHVKGVGVLRGVDNIRRISLDGRTVVSLPTMFETDNIPGLFFEGSLDHSHNNNTLSVSDVLQIPDDLAILSSPVVYGFVFNKQVWIEMPVDAIEPIKFQKDALKNLVLDENLKTMFSAIVSSSTVVNTDFIQGKGGGISFLLHGKPGVGKTATAESFAEHLRRPLYSVGVGELGSDPVEMEACLKSILNVAQSWGAILLIDEADIFLERRKNDDINRNAMVSIFLRLLEYYSGIVFFTSNRADDLDPAFHSRVSLTIKYHAHNEQDRRQIWKNLLNVIAPRDYIEKEEIELLAERDLNGRQIKNTIRLAVALRSESFQEYTLFEAIEAVLDANTGLGSGVEGRLKRMWSQFTYGIVYGFKKTFNIR